MAYRLVDTEIWDDEYIGDLEPEAKLVWLCLLTNDKANITGLYRITVKAIADMTGLDRARVEQIMARFDGAGKALYRDGWVFVVNYQEHQMRKVNKNIQAHITRYLNTVPDGYLKDAYGYRYPIDTLSIPSDEIGKEETGNKGLDGNREERAQDAPAAQANASPALPAPSFSDLNITIDAARESEWVKAYQDATGEWIANNPKARQWLIDLIGRHTAPVVLNGGLEYARLKRAEHGGGLKALDYYLKNPQEVGPRTQAKDLPSNMAWEWNG